MVLVVVAVLALYVIARHRSIQFTLYLYMSKVINHGFGKMWKSVQIVAFDHFSVPSIILPVQAETLVTDE